jgi:hypothetical protein
LFVRKDSLYKKLVFDCYDIERNAKKYPSPNPIIAHPPCRAWGKLKHFSKHTPEKKDLANWSIEQVRIYGGVIEHPKGSNLWKENNLPTGSQMDMFGGFTISIDQKWFGHKAKKETLLYIVGINPADLPAYSPCYTSVEYVVTGNKRTRKKEIPKKDREATPLNFALWLIEIAKKCKIIFHHQVDI